jgi:integrase
MAPGKRGRPARDAAPRVFVRRGAYAADLRRWNAGRPTLRNPDAPGWPEGGESTDDPEVALRWAIRYVDHYREDRRREQLKLGPRPKKVGAAADAWIEHRKVRPTATWQGNRAALNALRRFLATDQPSGRKGDDVRTSQITAALLQRMFDQLVKDGYAFNTLASYRQSISGFLRHLGYGDRNAAIGVHLDRPSHEEVYTWTDEELAGLRAAADRLDQSTDHRTTFRGYRLAVELALATGLRRNELFAIDWERFDPEARTVRVVRQLDKSDRRFVPPKGKRPGTALVLPSWWEYHHVDAKGLVLAEPNGEAVSPQTLAHIIRRLLKEAKLQRPGLGWHTFRHTYARDFIIGVRGDFGLLQKSLRHRSIVTTEKLYGHFHEDVAAGLARQRIYPDRALRAV